MKQQPLTPTSDEVNAYGISSFKGIDVGLGKEDPTAEIAAKLEKQYPNHLILVQAGKFLQAFNRSAHVLNKLKGYKIMLRLANEKSYLRSGFPAAGFKRRLWSLVDEFGISYVVAIGSKACGHTIHVSTHDDSNGSLMSLVSDQIVHQVISDLRQYKELNKAAGAQLVTNPESTGFRLKEKAEDLDTILLDDITKMTRDLRTTYGENIRVCMSRVMRNVYAYGKSTEKPIVLQNVSADVDLLKHYIEQAPGLKKLKFSFEHRATLAVELGKLVGGLIKSVEARS